VGLPLDVTWKMPDHAALHWEEWGEQYAVFDACSGETHLLNTVAGLALQELCSKAVSVTELCEELAGSLGLACNEQFVQQIEELLVQFHYLGLIEQCSV
jgi:PqqD family protein of HPr-rel-A system